MKGKQKSVYTLKLSGPEFHYIKQILTVAYNGFVENDDTPICEAFKFLYTGVDLGNLLEDFDNLDP